jgi:hypothetical protein
MDYWPVNIWPKGKSHGRYFPTTLGTYDYHVIHWATRPFPARRRRTTKSLRSPDGPRRRRIRVGAPATVYGTIGLRPGVTLGDVLPSVAAALDRRMVTKRASLIAWKDFPRETAAAFAPMVANGSLVALDSFPGTSFALAPTWEAYLASLNGRRRGRLRKKLRRSHEAVELETAVVQRPDGMTIAQIYALYRQTWARASNKFEELTPDFFREIARADAAHVVLLYESATHRLVAFMLCLIVGKRAVNRYVGLDYAFVRPWNLHFRLWETALHFMISAGATEVHSGPTSYRFKVDTGHDLVPVRAYVRHRNPLLHRFATRLTRKVMGRSRWAER